MVPGGGSWILAVLLGLTLVAADVPGFHEHRDTGPAWYDEECPSLRLAVASTNPGMLPVADTVFAIAPTEVMVPATPVGISRSCLASTLARAPPFAA